MSRRSLITRERFNADTWNAEDKLLMRFTLIDPSDPDREFAIVIDISKHMYSSTPKF